MKKHFTFFPLIVLSLLLLTTLKGIAQQPLYDCSGDQCTANDFVVALVQMIDQSGNILSDDFECDEGQETVVDLLVTFGGNTASDRWNPLIYADVYIDNVFNKHIEQCYDGLAIDVGSTLTITSADISWLCGKKIELRNLYLGWQPTSSQVCGCGGSKCSRPTSPILVYIPLNVKFSMTRVCDPGKANPLVTFTSETTGGTLPYTYLWEFQELYTLVTGATNSSTIGVRFNSGGIKTVTLYVTAGGKTKSETNTYNIEQCCDLKLSTPASGLTVECNGSGNVTDLNNWLASHGGAVVTDSPGITVTWTTSPSTVVISDGCGATGSATVTFTATDACGQSVSTTAIFTIADTTPPSINNTLKQNLTIECNGTSDPGGSIAAWLNNHAGATATDGCGGVTWSHNYTGLSDGCGATGSATVTFTATDDCGRTSTTTAMVTIVDTTPPSINNTLKQNLTVECNGTSDPGGAIAAWLNNHAGATATDECGGVTWSHNYTGLSDGCGATGSANVIFTAMDACGHTSTTTAMVTIVDTTPPLISNAGKQNLTVECNGTTDPGGAIAIWLNNHAGATATDGCGGVTWSHNYTGLSDGCGATGSATVTFTAIDACGLSSTTTAMVTIADTTPPLINNSGKQNLTVECDGSADPGGAIATWLNNHAGATATDGCGSVSWSHNYTGLSDGCGATGSANVTFTAIDACGRTSTTTAMVTIADTTPPVINNTGKQNLTVECNGTADPGGAIAAWLNNHAGATATDGCGGVTWSHNYTGLSDGCGATGSANVTFTAMDACGLTSTTTAMVTIVDITPPSINNSLKQNLTVECDGTADPGEEIAAWLNNHAGATATDACGGVTWSHNYTGLSDGCGATGSANVTFTAMDACGLTSTTTAMVTIVDTTPPLINNTGKINLTVECNGTSDPGGAIAAWLNSHAGAAATDGCGGVTWSHNYTGLSDGCGATGSATVTFTAMDACGLTSTTTAIVTIVDTTPPLINNSGKQNLTVECDGSADPGGAIATWLNNHAGATATDGCGNVSWSHNYTGLSDGCGATGSATVTFTAMDNCGVTSTTTAVVSVVDTTPPTFTVPENAVIYVDNDCDYDASVGKTGDVTDEDDECSTGLNATYSDVKIEGDCPGSFTISRTWSLEDHCGNQAVEQIQVITLKDTIRPVITCGTSVDVYLTEEGKWTLNPQNLADLLPVAQDNCTPRNDLIISTSPKFFDCNNVGKKNELLITVADLCGNISTCTSTEIMVYDTLAPVMKCKNITITLDEEGKAMIFPADVNDGADRESVPAWAMTFNHLEGGSWDNCGISFACLNNEEQDQLFTCDEIGVNTVTLRMRDPSNNESTCQATVTVVDNIPPVVQTVNNISLLVPAGTCETTVPNYPAISATDICGVTISMTSGLGQGGKFPLGTTVETYQVTDHGGNSATVSFTVNISTYNGAPTINSVADVTVQEDAGTVDIPISGISYGPDCTPQTVSVTASQNNPVLVTGMGLDYVPGNAGGNIKLTIAPNQSGESVLTITVKDNGGTQDGGIDTTVKTFRLIVTPVNDPPVLVAPIADQQVNAARTITIPISSAIGQLFNDIDPGDVLTVTATLSNGNPLPSFITVVGENLTVKPLLTDSGCYNIVVKATDLGGASVSDEFKLCVLGYVVGIEEIGKRLFEVKMYPNPTPGPVNLDITGSIREMEVSVFNILGVEIFRKEYLTPERITFDLSQYSTGMYFVKLNFEQLEVIKKLVLKKE